MFIMITLKPCLRKTIPRELTSPASFKQVTHLNIRILATIAWVSYIQQAQLSAHSILSSYTKIVALLSNKKWPIKKLLPYLFRIEGSLFCMSKCEFG